MRNYSQKNADRIFQALKSDYAIVGKRRIKGWHAWLTVGVAIGAVVTVGLVANRSGEFEAGEAANISLPKGPALTISVKAEALTHIVGPKTAFRMMTLKLDTMESDRNVLVPSVQVLLHASEAYTQSVLSNCQFIDGETNTVLNVQKVVNPVAKSDLINDYYRFQFDKPLNLNLRMIKEISLHCNIGKKVPDLITAFSWGVRVDHVDQVSGSMNGGLQQFTPKVIPGDGMLTIVDPLGFPLVPKEGSANPNRTR